MSCTTRLNHEITLLVPAVGDPCMPTSGLTLSIFQLHRDATSKMNQYRQPPVDNHYFGRHHGLVPHNMNNLMTRMPRHEAENERQFYRSCLHALRHPSELPSFFRTVYRDTKIYYSGQDLVDLEREELIENLAWTRRVGITAFTGAFVSLFFMFAQLMLCYSELHKAKKAT